jgi:hypothetical protein
MIGGTADVWGAAADQSPAGALVLSEGQSTAAEGAAERADVDDVGLNAAAEFPASASAVAGLMTMETPAAPITSLRSAAGMTECATAALIAPIRPGSTDANVAARPTASHSAVSQSSAPATEVAAESTPTTSIQACGAPNPWTSRLQSGRNRVSTKRSEPASTVVDSPKERSFNVVTLRLLAFALIRVYLEPVKLICVS